MRRWIEEEEVGGSGLRKRRIEGVDRGGGRRRCRMGEEDLSSLVILVRRGSRHKVVVMAATFGLRVCPQRLLSWELLVAFLLIFGLDIVVA